MELLKRQAKQSTPASFLLVFSVLRSLRTTITNISPLYANSEPIKRDEVEARQTESKIPPASLMQLGTAEHDSSL